VTRDAFWAEAARTRILLQWLRAANGTGRSLRRSGNSRLLPKVLEAAPVLVPIEPTQKSSYGIAANMCVLSRQGAHQIGYCLIRTCPRDIRIEGLVRSTLYLGEAPMAEWAGRKFALCIGSDASGSAYAVYGLRNCVVGCGAHNGHGPKQRAWQL
jgi:hypothetical protein